MRRLTIGLFCLCTTQVALANGGPAMMNEPLVQPAKNVAYQRAVRTLGKAHALLQKVADGANVAKIGFGDRSFELGEMHLRTPVVVFATASNGKRQHIGYAMQLKLGAERHGAWVNVFVSRRGHIANRLFSGTEGVFAMAHPELAEGTLQLAMEHDLTHERLDLVSRWNARRQSRIATTTPMILAPDASITAAAEKHGAAPLDVEIKPAS